MARARAAKEALGDKVFVLGHHYQRDEVIEFADVTGDSFKLAQQAAARPDAPWIVFCGVHFMAESADILTSDAVSYTHLDVYKRQVLVWSWTLMVNFLGGRVRGKSCQTVLEGSTVAD